MPQFKPPKASAPQCEGVPFDRASNVANENKRLFDDFDQTPAGKRDSNNCKALLRFENGAIFWSSKMAIDADGPAAGPGRLSGSKLDLDSGQDDTSLHFADGSGLPEREQYLTGATRSNISQEYWGGIRRCGDGHL